MAKTPWHKSLRDHVLKSTNGANKQHCLRVASLLQKMAEQLAEEDHKAHTALLTKYPHMPPKIFAACRAVSYPVGLSLYQNWHKDHGKPVPPRTRMSAKTKEEWMPLVLKERGL